MELLMIPSEVTPFLNSTETGKKPCVNASGSTSSPNVLRPVEKLRMILLMFWKSTGARIFGVLVSTAGGVPQVPQLPMNVCMLVLKETVRLGSDREFVVSPLLPVIGSKVVLDVYAASGWGIWMN